MKWAALLCGCGLALGTMEAAASWQEELSPAPKFAPMKPLRAHYKFGWGFVGAAEADFDFSYAKGGVLRMNLSTRSIGAPRVTWRMDATQTAKFNTATFRPIAMRMTEAYKDETITTELTFTEQGLERLRESNPPGANPAKVKKFELANVYDLHGALHFLRSQRLQTGDVYKFVVYATASPYLAHVSVTGREQVKALGKMNPTVKLELKLWQITKEMTLGSVERYKKASMWISDDAERIPLRVESEIFVGKVWGEMDRLQFKGPAPAEAGGVKP